MKPIAIFMYLVIGMIFKHPSFRFALEHMNLQWYIDVDKRNLDWRLVVRIFIINIRTVKKENVAGVEAFTMLTFLIFYRSI